MCGGGERESEEEEQCAKETLMSVFVCVCVGVCGWVMCAEEAVFVSADFPGLVLIRIHHSCPAPCPAPTPPLRSGPLCPSVSGEHQVWSNDDGNVSIRAGEGVGDFQPTSQTEIETGPG